MTTMSTVGELVDYLLTQPRDRPVILAKDAEENGFSPLAAAREGVYAADSTWSGEVYYPDNDDPDAYEPPEDAVPAIILGPVN